MQNANHLLYVAVITHKGRQVAQLMGDDRKALETRAHCYAANQNYHRAVVQIRPRPFLTSPAVSGIGNAQQTTLIRTA